MAETIGIFPLEYVLLPGLPLPLHIFEPRYRRLVADAGAAGQGHGSFGVVLGKAAALSGVGGGDSGEHSEHVLAEIGTMAEIVDKEPYADGRFDLLTVGSRRFRVEEFDLTGQPYLQARVEFLPEDDGVLDQRVLAASRRLSDRYGEVLASIGGPGDHDELATDPMLASYQIAARLHLTAQERQSLLTLPSAGERLSEEVQILRREIALLLGTRSVPVPPQILHVKASVS